MRQGTKWDELLRDVLYISCSGEHLFGERLLSDELPELCQMPPAGLRAHQ